MLLLLGATTTAVGGLDVTGFAPVLVYLVVLAAIEEIVFRDLLLTGLAALTGQPRRRWSSARSRSRCPTCSDPA